MSWSSELAKRGSEAGRRGDVRDGCRWHLARLNEIAEALERLQHDEEREPRARLAGPLGREDELCRSRREGPGKLGVARARPQPRLGSQFPDLSL